MKTIMSLKQAIQWHSEHTDNDELDSDELEAAFQAIYERPADDQDREDGLWSLICAAMNGP